MKKTQVAIESIDAFDANRLVGYLEEEYKGGPIAMGSARFRRGR